MPQYFRLANPGVSSIGCDGKTHLVNEDGLLVVEQFTEGLPALLKHHGAKDVPPGTLSPVAMAEREALFAEFEQLSGKAADRRRSLKQMRELVVDLRAKPKAGGISKSAAGGSGDDPPP